MENSSNIHNSSRQSSRSKTFTNRTIDADHVNDTLEDLRDFGKTLNYQQKRKRDIEKRRQQKLLNSGMPILEHMPANMCAPISFYGKDFAHLFELYLSGKMSFSDILQKKNMKMHKLMDTKEERQKKAELNVVAKNRRVGSHEIKKLYTNQEFEDFDKEHLEGLKKELYGFVKDYEIKNIFQRPQGRQFAQIVQKIEKKNQDENQEVKPERQDQRYLSRRLSSLPKNLERIKKLESLAQDREEKKRNLLELNQLEYDEKILYGKFRTIADDLVLKIKNKDLVQERTDKKFYLPGGKAQKKHLTHCTIIKNSTVDKIPTIDNKFFGDYHLTFDPHIKQSFRSCTDDYLKLSAQENQNNKNNAQLPSADKISPRMEQQLYSNNKKGYLQQKMPKKITPIIKVNFKQQGGFQNDATSPKSYKSSNYAEKSTQVSALSSNHNVAFAKLYRKQNSSHQLSKFNNQSMKKNKNSQSLMNSPKIATNFHSPISSVHFSAKENQLDKLKTQQSFDNQSSLAKVYQNTISDVQNIEENILQADFQKLTPKKLQKIISEDKRQRDKKISPQNANTGFFHIRHNTVSGQEFGPMFERQQSEDLSQEASQDESIISVTELQLEQLYQQSKFIQKKIFKIKQEPIIKQLQCFMKLEQLNGNIRQCSQQKLAPQFSNKGGKYQV